MKQRGNIICLFLMVFGVAASMAQGVPEQRVDIRFTLCLLPINKSAYFQYPDGSDPRAAAYYVAPKVSYRNGEETVEFSITHGHSEKGLRYVGAADLKFFHPEAKGAEAGPIASVKINPAWKHVLILAISDPAGDGRFKMMAMDYDKIQMDAGEVYVYNLTPDRIYTAVGDVKHALSPGAFQQFDCDLSDSSLQHVVMVTERAQDLKFLYRSNAAFNPNSSNLVVVYHENQNPDHTKVQFVYDLSIE